MLTFRAPLFVFRHRQVSIHETMHAAAFSAGLWGMWVDDAGSRRFSDASAPTGERPRLSSQ